MKRNSIVASALVGMLLIAMTLPSPLETVQRANAGPTSVRFDVLESDLSGVYRTIADIGEDITVEPGDQVPLTLSALQDTATLTLDLGIFGSYDVDFDTPLGSFSIPIVPVVPGVLTINLDITGSLRGTLWSSAGSFSETAFQWTSWGVKSATFYTEGVPDNTDINIEMDMAYTLSIGVSVTVPIFGAQEVISVDIGAVEGSTAPSRVVHVRSPSLAGDAGLLLLVIVLVVIIMVVVIAVWALFMRKKTPPPVMVEETPPQIFEPEENPFLQEDQEQFEKEGFG